MRARRTIAGNEAGRPGPPVYLRGHRRRRRRGAAPLVLDVLVLASLALIVLFGLEAALNPA
ncbi:MAG: hypothetical protein ACK4I0_01420 [Brevundimonas sp.]|uniref:hypothetical protein n=1 Tax=Brevundimonas sp. TaxID=1871086 RepID=UPI00391D7841